MKHRAFTLVELLIVLTIIALLAGITVPAASRSTELARRTVCATNLSNLSKLLVTFQLYRRGKDELVATLGPLPEKGCWPQRIGAYRQAGDILKDPLFICPSENKTFGGGISPMLYWSPDGFTGRGRFIPFDPDDFSCASRRGTDENGPYTEYCCEDNKYVEAKWGHGDCCGQPKWSWDDGIWRIPDAADEDGYRVITLLDYQCSGNWDNQLWIGEELVWTDFFSHIGDSFRYRDVVTNYGYNVDVGGTAAVSPDTVVLLDYNYVFADQSELTMPADLSSSQTARHFGKMNVLYASGAVRVVGPTELYPDADPTPWTSAAD